MATIPVPASNETLAAAPSYIPEDETWPDPEWREAAATRDGARTEAQQLLYIGGPRPHPWGLAAFVGVLDDTGRRAYFPSRAAYDAWRAQQDAARPAAAGEAALGVINAGLAAAHRR